MKSLDNERYRHIAAKRLKYCWGECVGEVFILAAVIALAVLAFLIVTECLFRAGVISFGVGSLGEGGWKLGLTAAVCACLLYIMLIPLKYGSAWFYFQEAKATSIPGSGFLSCYMHKRHIKRTLELEMTVFAKRLAMAAVPAAFLGAMAWHVYSLLERNPAAAAANLAVSAVIGAVVVYFYIIFFIRYSFVPYLYAADPEKSAKEIIAESIKISKGFRLGIVKLMFSLAPLWISCIAVFPLIFVIPYTKMTFASAFAEIFYRYYSDEENSGNSESIKEEVLV